MKQVEERYISLLTDFGFDRLFEEAEIARNMLADGVDLNLIMKYSGLTQEQIEKLK